jgi:hypothetical protein
MAIVLPSFEPYTRLILVCARIIVETISEIKTTLMKRKFVFLALLLLISGKAYMQDIRLNAYGNYVFDDDVDSYYSNTSYYNGTIKGGFLWGFGLEYWAQKRAAVELLYYRLDTKAPLEYYDGAVKRSDFDLGMNYLMVGGTSVFGDSKKVEPYAGAMLGMGFGKVTNPTNGRSGNFTKFAWGFKLGANIWASDKVGVKLQTQLLSCPQSVGGGVYFGTGGAGAGVSAYSSMYQFTLGGGLTFRLGR